MKSFEIFNSINKCRSCYSKQITKIFSLGHQCFGGIFPSSKKQNIPTGPLELIKCKKCELIKLKHNFNRGKMFGINYGYESGICLPSFPTISTDQIEYVSSAIKAYYEQK